MEARPWRCRRMQPASGLGFAPVSTPSCRYRATRHVPVTLRREQSSFCVGWVLRKVVTQDLHQGRWRGPVSVVPWVSWLTGRVSWWRPVWPWSCRNGSRMFRRSPRRQATCVRSLTETLICWSPQPGCTTSGTRRLSRTPGSIRSTGRGTCAVSAPTRDCGSGRPSFGREI